LARNILTSGDVAAVNGLKVAIITIHGEIDDKKNIEILIKKVKKLEAENNALKGISGGCTETVADRETGLL